MNVVIARLTAQQQKNVGAQIGQCETVGRYESDIARFSVMNEVFDDVDRSGSGIAMFRYVDLANIRSACSQRPGSRREECQRTGAVAGESVRRSYESAVEEWCILPAAWWWLAPMV